MYAAQHADRLSQALADATRRDIDTVRMACQLLDQVEALWRDRIQRFGEVVAERPTEGAST